MLTLTFYLNLPVDSISDRSTAQHVNLHKQLSWLESVCVKVCCIWIVSRFQQFNSFNELNNNIFYNEKDNTKQRSKLVKLNKILPTFVFCWLTGSQSFQVLKKIFGVFFCFDLIVQPKMDRRVKRERQTTCSKWSQVGIGPEPLQQGHIITQECIIYQVRWLLFEKKKKEKEKIFK